MVIHIPHPSKNVRNFALQMIMTLQGRNQDLNLAKSKYEILTGRKNRSKKLYKMTVYQAKTLKNDCLPTKNCIK